MRSPLPQKRRRPGGEETGGNGGKDSVKENRQGCLSRLVRAGADRLQKRCVPHCSKKETPGGEETGGNGGKDSVKENRQDCLSRSIRAGGV